MTVNEIKKAIGVENENPQTSIVNSVVEVKATAALSRKVQEELATETKELDIEELLDAKKDKGND